MVADPCGLDPDPAVKKKTESESRKKRVRPNFDLITIFSFDIKVNIMDM